MRKIIILGGGYGGLTAAKELAGSSLPDDVEITLVDRLPYQGLKTEYYALAAGTISDMDIRVHYDFEKNSPVSMKFGEVDAIDLDTKTVSIGEEKLDYDRLIIALGCTDKYHGIPGADLYTNSVQSLSQARKTYQNVCNIKPYGQVTIVGGGLSGVEIAAELRESRSDLNIRIIDRGASILSTFPDKLVSYVRDWFERHDVEMCSHTSLIRIDKDVLYSESKQMFSDATVWTAGIQPNELVQRLDLPKDVQGRVTLNKLHQIPQHPDVYVVGDCASLPFSPSGQLAEAQGKQVAEVIEAELQGKTAELGKIKLKGVLGSLGKNAGFGLMGKKTMLMTGKVPRVLKSGVLWMSKRHFG